MKKFVFFLTVIFYTYDCLAQAPVVNPSEHIGDTITVQGRIYAGYHLLHVKTQPTFLNVYDSSPKHHLLLRIDSGNRNKFPADPEKYFLNKNVSVRGRINDYKGVPLITVTDSSMIVMLENDTAYKYIPETAGRFMTGREFNFGKVAAKPKPLSQKNKADTVNHGEWLKRITTKQFDPVSNDVRIINQELPLLLNPSSNSNVLAYLPPRTAITILYRSSKWSYISAAPENSEPLYGFVKNRKYRKLKKEGA